jgi:hypothetical protein
MPQAEVARHFYFVKTWVQGRGYDVGSVKMPSIRVFTGLDRKDMGFYARAAKGFLMTKGFDMDSGQMEEHGSVRPPEVVPAFILGGPDGFTILVKKGFGGRAIRHEMLHLFETHLNLPPGTFEKKNLDIWKLHGVSFG